MTSPGKRTNSDRVRLVLKPSQPPAPGYALRVLVGVGTPLLVGIPLGHFTPWVPAALGALFVTLGSPLRPTREHPRIPLIASFVGGIGFALGATVAPYPLIAAVAFAAITFATMLVPGPDARYSRSWFYLCLLMLAALTLADLWVGGPLQILVTTVAGGLWGALLLRIAVGRRPRTYSTLHSRAVGLKKRMHWKSPIFRRAVYLTAIATSCLGLAYLIGDDHVGWIAVSAVSVLQPDPNGHVTRGINRVVGTLIGAGASLLIVSIHPDPLLLGTLAVASIAAAAYFRFYHHGIYMVFMTLFVVLFASCASANPAEIATARAIDTVIGTIAAVVLGVIAVPKKERRRFGYEMKRARRKVQELHDGPIAKEI